MCAARGSRFPGNEYEYSDDSGMPARCVSFAAAAFLRNLQKTQGTFIIKQFFRGGKRVVKQLFDLVYAVKARASVYMELF